MTTWEDRILNALGTGTFDPMVKRAAASWDTCAIAECLPAMDRQWIAILPLKHDDTRVRWHELGLAFNLAVQADDPHAAQHLLGEMRRLQGAAA